MASVGESGTGRVALFPALTEMATGYFRSRVICAAARLGIAEALGGDERSVEEVAASCGAHPDALYRLLRGLASIGVVAEHSPRRFSLTPLGQPLRKDAPNSEWASIVFWADLLADPWSHLTECIRTGDSAARIAEREGVTLRWSKDPDSREIFGAVMGSGPAENYMPIARAWDFSKHHTVADLGGGGGALIAAVLQTNSGLQGMLVDRPEFLEKSAERLEREGLTARCQCVAANLREAVPPGADVYMLKHVLHGYDDAASVEILRHCRSVLPEDGRILVIEFVIPDVIDHADPDLEGRLMSDLNMLAVTGGKERSATEWKNLLESAGLTCQRIISVPGDLASIVEAGL
ncbi:MAG TPA: methyltransferase [Bryobacteraceae bacterium]|nr:methyltransferase [Bryobacteraceae bacterium]